jgi:hypothetical protein
VAFIGDVNARCAPAFLSRKGVRHGTTAAFKQTISLQDRLAEFVADARSEADAEPAGADQYELQKKIRQAETAANIERWANSLELQPPK